MIDPGPDEAHLAALLRASGRSATSVRGLPGVGSAGRARRFIGRAEACSQEGRIVSDRVLRGEGGGAPLPHV